MADGPSVAVVVLDTLRKDAFDDHFDWLDGVRYENAWSTSHWTVPAHASLFTGLYASEAGVYAGAQELDYPGAVLAEQLRDAGYTTRAFSANVNVSKPFDFHRGFDEFEGSWRLESLHEDVFDWEQFIDETRDMGPQRYAIGLWRCLAGDCATVPSLRRGLLLKARDLGIGTETVDDGAVEALDYVGGLSATDQEFLFVNLMEAHTPYNPPADYRTVDPPNLNGLRATLSGGPDADPEDVRTAYNDAVRYLSDIYRDIHGELVEEYDYVFTLADHGELLGEYDAWEHLCGLQPQLTHVPLVVSGPESGALATPTDRPVSILDVYQTVLDVAGVDRPAGTRGQSLLTGETDGDLLTEYHGLTERHRRSLDREGFAPDLVDSYDREFHGVVTPDAYAFESPDGELRQWGDGEVDDPRERIQAILETLDRRDVESDREVSAAVERQLEDLGYG